MTDFSLGYQADVTKFSDEEIGRLIEEIEDSGALMMDDRYDDPDSWEAAAHDRWGELIDEKNRRWRLANPEEVARRKPFEDLCAAMVGKITRETTEKIFMHSPMLDRLRGK